MQPVLFDLRRGISFAFADGSELFFPFSKGKRDATDAQVSVLTVANAVPRALNKQRGFDPSVAKDLSVARDPSVRCYINRIVNSYRIGNPSAAVLMLGAVLLVLEK